MDEAMAVLWWVVGSVIAGVVLASLAAVVTGRRRKQNQKRIHVIQPKS